MEPNIKILTNELSYHKLCLTSHFAFCIPSIFTSCFPLWFYFLIACNLAMYFASCRAFYITLSRSCFSSYSEVCPIALPPAIMFNFSLPFMVYLASLFPGLFLCLLLKISRKHYYDFHNIVEGITVRKDVKNFLSLWKCSVYNIGPSFVLCGFAYSRIVLTWEKKLKIERCYSFSIYEPGFTGFTKQLW